MRVRTGDHGGLGGAGRPGAADSAEAGLSTAAHGAPDLAAAVREIAARTPGGITLIGEYPVDDAGSQAFPVPIGSDFFTSGGFVRYGFAIPAALGAATADPDRAVWAVTDAAGFQISAREIATAAVEGIPLHVLVDASRDRSVPDVTLLGEALGAVGITVRNDAELVDAVDFAVRNPDRSVVLELAGARSDS